MAQIVKIVKVFPYSNYAVVYWEENGHFPWVACWCPKVHDDFEDKWITPQKYCEGAEQKCYWGQGHYFGTEEDATKWATEQEEEAVGYKIEALQDYLKEIRA